MRDLHVAPLVVVGIDGSRTATRAAVWAVDEAVSRDVPLRLVYVIDPVGLCGADADHIQFASARAALHEAHGAVEATGEPVKIETEIVVGKPVAKLIVESRSAAMLCVGSIGIKHACTGVDFCRGGLGQVGPLSGGRDRPGGASAGNPRGRQHCRRSEQCCSATPCLRGGKTARSASTGNRLMAS